MGAYGLSTKTFNFSSDDEFMSVDGEEYVVAVYSYAGELWTLAAVIAITLCIFNCRRNTFDITIEVQAVSKSNKELREDLGIVAEAVRACRNEIHALKSEVEEREIKRLSSISDALIEIRMLRQVLSEEQQILQAQASALDEIQANFRVLNKAQTGEITTEPSDPKIADKQSVNESEDSADDTPTPNNEEDSNPNITQCVS